MRFGRFLCAAAAAVMISSAVPLTAMAESVSTVTIEKEYASFEQGNLEYTELADGTLSVKATKSAADTMDYLYIRNNVNGKKVTVIEENGFSGCDKIRSIVIEEGVTTINDYAFFSNYSSNLEVITIPSSVIFIGSNPFSNAYSPSNILYNGTESQWKKLLSNSEWDGSNWVYLGNFNYEQYYPKVYYGTSEEQTTKPHAPESVTSLEPAPDRVNLMWSEVDNATSYIVMYSNDGGNSWLSATSDSNKITLCDLLWDTDYIYKIAAKNGDVEGDFSQNYSFKTAVGKLGVPVNATSAEPTADSVTLAWSKVDGAMVYIVMFSEDGGKNWTTATSELSLITLDGLKQNTKYTYKIAAKNGDTEGDFSEEYTFKTAAAEDNSSKRDPSSKRDDDDDDDDDNDRHRNKSTSDEDISISTVILIAAIVLAVVIAAAVTVVIVVLKKRKKQ